MSLLKNVVTSVLRPWIPQVVNVRYRYHADKIAKGQLVRRMNYNDPIETQGTLAHTGPTKRIKQMPLYRPDNPWKERKALFGQNDYIDILGNDKIHPTNILYNVPSWLRGVSGNEYQVLLRRKKMWEKGVFPIARPTKWKHINQRIIYLYKYLNRKTKTNLSKQ